MNPLKNYQSTRIMTASPGELLVMLYDGLLQRVRGGALYLEKGKPGRAGEHLGRAQDILHELMRTLDRDKSPALCDSLLNLYSYCSKRCLDAIAQADPAPLREVYDLLKPLRDAWVEANEQLKRNPELQRVANG